MREIKTTKKNEIKLKINIEQMTIRGEGLGIRKVESFGLRIRFYSYVLYVDEGDRKSNSLYYRL